MNGPLSLKLVEVGVSYGRRPVVADVTTPAFAGGDVIALLGPNGAGKSTLLKRLAGLLTGPGQVALTGAGPHEVGYLPQDHAAPVGLSVYESVLLAAKRDAAWRVASETLVQVDATLDRLGLTDLAGRGLDELSGGQRQMVSIAQSLVRRPRVLLMDEPTSALDLHRQLEVLGVLRDLARGRGVIVVVSLHDVNLALRFASHALVMAGGRMLGCGSAAEVISAKMMQAAFHVEARIERCSRGRIHVMVDGPCDGPAHGAPAL
ncbi:ABC transporter ATP-binding protein [Aquabacter sp. L1I39]|uniref:ABC transporter ATP-binding protein n=1 Tax=Aquabacter sp. L1I39 TaxID=2820278 RepID=UPI001AD9BA82|nr:ABC transporter ATP-binding protein [Aquabacter sp. L1I39]QTL03954.1 ABC transporter ATP-binding protein [Aquabacter sp. L1I39]